MGAGECAGTWHGAPAAASLARAAARAALLPLGRLHGAFNDRVFRRRSSSLQGFGLGKLQGVLFKAVET